MTYLSLASMARGIMYFSYQRLNSQWWEDWAEVKKMNDEMDRFKGFLTMPWTPVDASTSNEAVRIGESELRLRADHHCQCDSLSSDRRTFGLPE